MEQKCASWVSTVASTCRAWAAISESCGGIGGPRRSSGGRIGLMGGLWGHDRLPERFARTIARRLDGRVVSGCQLYSRGGTAQIEAVGTLEGYRDRGLASSVVKRAVAEAFRSGHDLVWILAEEDDWPKALYAKLGFNPAGRFCAFTRGTS